MIVTARNGIGVLVGYSIPHVDLNSFQKDAELIYTHIFLIAMDKDTSVKVAVRIRPLSTEEAIHEPVLCLDTIPEGSQVISTVLVNYLFPV